MWSPPDAMPAPGASRTGEPGLPGLDIIIVNWNSGPELSACLASVQATARERFRLGQIIVVDNGSTDGSLENLPAVPARISIVRNPKNRGFAAACNRGAALGDSEYLLFLNPDTKLMSDSLQEPVRFMESAEHADVGVVGIQLIGDNGEIARSCAREPRPGLFVSKMLGLDQLAPRWFPSLIVNEWDHRDSRPVDHVIGAFYLVRRRLWEALAGFDERFFVYLEDLDFSTRARAAGWQIYYLSRVRAFHRGGGASAAIKPARVCLSLHSRIRFGYKHFRWWTGTALLLGTLFLEPIARLSRALARLDLPQARDTVESCYLIWRWLLLGTPPNLEDEPSALVPVTGPRHG